MIRDFSAYKGSTPNPLNLGLVDIFTVNCSWCLVFSDPSKVRNIWREAVVFSFWDPFIRRVVQKPTHHIFVGKNLSMAFVWYLVDGWWVDTVGGSLFRLILCYITRWWFQICFMFIPIWGNDPIWLIFFKWVETTNLISSACPVQIFLRLLWSAMCSPYVCWAWKL